MLLKLQSRTIDLSGRTYIMGIINCTPDSFYGESRRTTLQEAVDVGVRMVAEGADFLDVGGESSRPGSEPVTTEEEMRRVLPVIEQLAREVDVPISVDTYKASVAERALDCGAEIINDISALQYDSDLARIAATYEAVLVLMHIKGRPKEMQLNPAYDDVVHEIYQYLEERLNTARKAGIARDKIILDPGIGFGKRLRDNYEITQHLDRFAVLGCPILFGASRKSFLSNVLDLPAGECLEATIAVNAIALLRGAHILRVHDVKEAKRAAQVVDYLIRNT
ncbi:MAG: dihydropteroate synthase [bacterium]